MGLEETDGKSDGTNVGDCVGPDGADDIEGLAERDGDWLSEGELLGTNEGKSEADSVG